MFQKIHEGLHMSSKFLRKFFICILMLQYDKVMFLSTQPSKSIWKWSLLFSSKQSSKITSMFWPCPTLMSGTLIRRKEGRMLTYFPKICHLGYHLLWKFLITLWNVNLPNGENITFTIGGQNKYLRDQAFPEHYMK